MCPRRSDDAAHLRAGRLAVEAHRALLAGGSARRVELHELDRRPRRPCTSGNSSWARCATRACPRRGCTSSTYCMFLPTATFSHGLAARGHLEDVGEGVVLRRRRRSARRALLVSSRASRTQSCTTHAPRSPPSRLSPLVRMAYRCAMVEHSTRGLKLVSTETAATEALAGADAVSVVTVERDHDFVQSLERGLAVLRCLSRRPSRAHAVRRRSPDRSHPGHGAPSPAHVRATRLHAQRRPAASSSRRWCSTSATATSRRCKLPDIAQPYMEALSERVHESVSASVLDGDEIVYVARVPTKRIMTIALALGSRLRPRSRRWAGCCSPISPTASCARASRG